MTSAGAIACGKSNLEKKQDECTIAPYYYHDLLVLMDETAYHSILAVSHQGFWKIQLG
jgi:hypothetical protein